MKNKTIITFSMAMLFFLYGTEMVTAQEEPEVVDEAVEMEQEDSQEEAAEEETTKEETSQEETVVQTDTKEQVEDPAVIVQQYETNLDEAYQEYVASGGPSSADLYLDAKGRIAAFEKLVAKGAKGEKLSDAFEMCALSTEAAMVFFATEENNMKAATIDAKKASLLNELHNLHETIGGIERSRASKLKEDLDKERKNAQQLRDEMERKFSELQSELINVRKDARGTIISMSDILFDVGKASLTNDLKTSLAKIAGILMVYKDVNVLVEGHTDTVGTEAYNQKLSEERAENVLQYLIEQGVDASRLTSVGYAFHRPIASNATKEGRQKNRRVDLVIQDNKKTEQ